MTFYHFKISNSFRLLTLLEKLLTADDCGTEEKVLEWVNILVTGHYLQITMCKVQEMDVLRTRLQETVARIQERIKTMTDCQVMIKNLLSSKVPPVIISNQIYSIEIIQI